MSCAHVRPTTNRSGTLLKTGETKHIKLKVSFVDLSQIVSDFKPFKPFDKDIFQLFYIVAPILSILKILEQ